MAKANRKTKAQRHAERSVSLGRRVVELGEHVARYESAASLSPEDRWIGSVMVNVLGEWQRDRVVLRVDPDLLGALAATPGDVELSDAWLDRFPCGSIAVALEEPLVINDDGRRCSYAGFIACGTRTQKRTHQQVPRSIQGKGLEWTNWTTYGPVHESDGVRFLWLFVDQDGLVGAQSISPYFRRDNSDTEVPVYRTIGELIAAVSAAYAERVGNGAEDAAVLVPASLNLLLYLASAEPDLDQVVPPAKLTRPMTGATILDAGWRVGGALRTCRAEAAPAGSAEQGPSGWHLPPHIRAAHWHRVRVATRDELGAIVGSTTGDQGTDWHYELRWYPPTPVNVGDGGPAPVVRTLDPEPREVAGGQSGR